MFLFYILMFLFANLYSQSVSNDILTKKELKITPGEKIKNPARVITADVSEDAIKKGDAFAQEITDRFVSDFEKPIDKMAHVSTFIVIDDMVYMSYYANTKEPSEDPKNQTARFVYAPIDDIDNKTFHINNQVQMHCKKVHTLL